MKKNDLAVFRLEKEGMKIELEAHRRPVPVVSQPAAQSVPSTAPAPVQTSAPAESPEERRTTFKEVVSPMVGTFYRAPSPDSAPYVQVGQYIKKYTVVCLIDAIQTLNSSKPGVKAVP